MNPIEKYMLLAILVAAQETREIQQAWSSQDAILDRMNKGVWVYSTDIRDVQEYMGMTGPGRPVVNLRTPKYTSTPLSDFDF